MCISADGCVTTPDGWPVQLADPSFAAGASYGFPEFQESCDAVLRGRTTFEPALGADRWPWPDLDLVIESDPSRLLERVREANRGGDVHLVGGPRTVETFRAMGALDNLGLIVVPLIVGDGMRLTPPLDPETRLTSESERALSGGAVEIVYAVHD